MTSGYIQSQLATGSSGAIDSGQPCPFYHSSASVWSAAWDGLPADGSPAAADWLRPEWILPQRPILVLAVALTMASIAALSAVNRTSAV